MMWGEKYGYKIKELNFQKGDAAVSKRLHLSLKVFFGYLKEEQVHRLVRISPFDSNAKRHTSFASVYVYPLAMTVSRLTLILPISKSQPLDPVVLVGKM
jgi:peptide chain release factor 2